jgi:hypothetical protein
MEIRGTSVPPRRFNAPELARVGVQVVGTQPIRLACMLCGAQWFPRIEPDGRIAHRYWVCVECRLQPS